MPATKTVSLSPMLSVRRGAKVVDYYKAAFGAEELFRIEAEDHGVVARLAVGGAEFWVADEAPEFLNFSPESLPPQFGSGTTVRLVMLWTIQTQFSPVL
jgi:PhnB protein